MHILERNREKNIPVGHVRETLCSPWPEGNPSYEGAWRLQGVLGTLEPSLKCPRSVSWGVRAMLLSATMIRAAYDPETISMLSTVLERAVAALPPQQRTDEGKARLASSILAAAARGERDPHSTLCDRARRGCLGTQHWWSIPYLTTGLPEGQCCRPRAREGGARIFTKPSRG